MDRYEFFQLLEGSSGAREKIGRAYRNVVDTAKLGIDKLRGGRGSAVNTGSRGQALRAQRGIRSSIPDDRALIKHAGSNKRRNMAIGAASLAGVGLGARHIMKGRAAAAQAASRMRKLKIGGAVGAGLAGLTFLRRKDKKRK